MLSVASFKFVLYSVNSLLYASMKFSTKLRYFRCLLNASFNQIKKKKHQHKQFICRIAQQPSRKTHILIFITPAPNRAHSPRHTMSLIGKSHAIICLVFAISQMCNDSPFVLCGISKRFWFHVHNFLLFFPCFLLPASFFFFLFSMQPTSGWQFAIVQLLFTRRHLSPPPRSAYDGKGNAQRATLGAEATFQCHTSIQSNSVANASS